MDALIRHYLGVEPADKIDDYIHQAAQAFFLEKRYWNSMAKIMGASK